MHRPILVDQIQCVMSSVTYSFSRCISTAPAFRLSRRLRAVTPRHAVSIWLRLCKNTVSSKVHGLESNEFCGVIRGVGADMTPCRDN